MPILRSISEWVHLAGRGIGFMCQWCQLSVPPNSWVPAVHEVRWDVGGGRRELQWSNSREGWSAGHRAGCGYMGMSLDTHRPCPSRSSRVSPPLLLFRPHSAGQKSLQGVEAGQEILLCQNEDHFDAAHMAVDPIVLHPKGPPWGPITQASKANLTHAVGSLAALAAQQRITPPPPVNAGEHLDGQSRKLARLWLAGDSKTVVTCISRLCVSAPRRPHQTCPRPWLAS